jgi:hypothetical protein
VPKNDEVATTDTSSIVLTPERKEEIERYLVNSMLEALKNHQMTLGENREAANFVLDNIDEIHTTDELLSFLNRLATRWNVLRDVYLQVKNEETSRSTSRPKVGLTGSPESAISPTETPAERAKRYADHPLQREIGSLLELFDSGVDDDVMERAAKLIKYLDDNQDNVVCQIARVPFEKAKVAADIESYYRARWNTTNDSLRSRQIQEDWRLLGNGGGIALIKAYPGVGNEIKEKILSSKGLAIWLEDNLILNALIAVRSNKIPPISKNDLGILQVIVGDVRWKRIFKDAEAIWSAVKR